jgi:tetratricopeptide (TPR) repeat protein
MLVISGGGDINRYRSPRIDELLPINPTGVTQVSSFSSLAERYGQAGLPKALPVIDGTLRSGCLNICSQGKTPLLSLRRYGLGAVVFSGMDLAAPEVRDWAGGRAMWADLIGRAQPEQSMGAALREVAISPMQSSTLGQLADALGGQQSTQAPGSAQIGFFLVGYIACLAPLNYLILKRKDRREWAWLTAPVIVILFSGGAYAVGKSVKGSQLFLSYVTVVDATEGQETNPSVTIAAVFSPSQTRYNVHVDDVSAQGSDVSTSYNQFLGQDQQDILVSHNDGTIIRDSLVAMWDNRLYSFRGNAKLSGPIHATVVGAGANQVRVTVTNNGKHRLTGCGLVMGGSTESLPDLDPGATATKEVTLNMGAGYRRIPSPSNSNREATIAQAAAQALNLTTTQEQAIEPLLFVGWSPENAAGVSLQGESPTLAGATMIAAHLALPPGMATLQTNQRRAMYNQAIQGLNAQPSFSGSNSPAANASQLNNQAYTYANAGQLDQALAAAKAASALTPQDGNIVDTVAEMHQRRKEYKEAEALYVKALVLQSGGGSSETHFKFGQTLAALSKKTDAISHLQTAASMDPSFVQRANQELAKLGVTSASTPTPSHSPPGSVSTTEMGNGDRGIKRTVTILQDGRQEVRTESWRTMGGSRTSQESVQVLGAGTPLPRLIMP